MFVLKASRRSTSMARIRQWLILLLRILAVAVLVVAVSRPLLGGWLGWQFSGAPDTVIILIDRSASMGLSYGKGKNCLDQGVKLLIDAGNKTAPDSRIILIDSAVMVSKQIPTWDVLKDLSETEITQTAADIPALFRKALDYMLTNGTGVTEIWCLSDMQRSNWDTENSAWMELENKFKSLPQPLTFRVLATGSEKTGNRSLSFVRIIGYSTPDGKRVNELVFDVQSDSQADETDVPLVLFISGAKRQINITLRGNKTRIRHTFAESEKDKTSFGYIELPPDANPQDNRFYFAYGKQPKQKTLILTQNRLLGDILSAAAAPESTGQTADVEVCSPAESVDRTFDDIALLIWKGFFPVGKMHKKLTAFLNRGGVALFFPPETPGQNSAEKKLNKNRNRWSQIIDFPKNKPQHVVEWFHSGGPLADTVSGNSLPVDSLEILRIRTLAGGMRTASALYTSGRPFLYLQNAENEGKLYICSTLPVESWSNLGEGVILVPMLNRMKVEGAQRFSQIIYAACGMWHPENNGNQPESLLDKKSLKSSPESASDFKCNSGIYSAESKIVILNRPEVEDIPGEIDQTEVKALFKERPFYMFNESGKNDSAFQSEVWRWFLIAMFCCLMAESFLLMPKKSDN